MNESTSAKTGKGRGRPPRHNERTSKVTVVLLHRHDIFLDRLLLTIKERSFSRVSKSELLRALIEAVVDSGIELSGCSSEEDVKNALLEKMRKRRAGP